MADDTMKIIIVDDETDLREMLSERLRKEGFYVLEGEHGKIGLELFHQNTDVDLVVSDQLMPEMNGFELIDEIRKIKTAKQLPILLITGTHDTEGQEKEIIGIIQGVMAKPFDLDTFAIKVKEILSH